MRSIHQKNQFLVFFPQVFLFLILIKTITDILLMKTSTFFYALLTSVIMLPPANACIWQNDTSPFWPSRRIEVCFVNPDANDQQNRESYQQAQNIVIQAFQNIDQQTDFSFFGFSQCNDTLSPQRSSKIRVDLSTTVTVGQAASIGPSSAQSAANLTLPYLARTNKDSSDHTLQNSFAIQYILTHEALHLLGFHHDRSRDNVKDLGQYTSPTILVGDFDPLSVMNLDSPMGVAAQANRNNPTGHPILSPGDISCLNQVANRTIQQNSSTPSTPMEPDSEVPSEQ